MLKQLKFLAFILVFLVYGLPAFANSFIAQSTNVGATFGICNFNKQAVQYYGPSAYMGFISNPIVVNPNSCQSLPLLNYAISSPITNVLIYIQTADQEGRMGIVIGNLSQSISSLTGDITKTLSIASLNTNNKLPTYIYAHVGGFRPAEPISVYIKYQNLSGGLDPDFVICTYNDGETPLSSQRPCDDWVFKRLRDGS